MPRTDDVAAFVKVVETGGFSAAAPALKLTPSAVSKLIARLEQRLGVRLLQRTTRQVRCTPEGDAYFQRVSRILADLEAAENDLASRGGVPHGLLRINTSVAFGYHQLAPILPEFLERYPEVKVELEVEDRFIDLIAEGFDVAIRFGRQADSSLVARKIGEIRRSICATPDYLRRHGTPRKPEDLLRHNCLNFSTQVALNRWPIREGSGRIREIDVSGNFLGNNGELVFRMTLAGVGLMRLADFIAAPAIRDGRLVRVLERYSPRDSLPLYAVWAHRRFLPPKVRVFVDFLIEKFSANPPWVL